MVPTTCGEVRMTTKTMTKRTKEHLVARAPATQLMLYIAYFMTF